MKQRLKTIGIVVAALLGLSLILALLNPRVRENRNEPATVVKATPTVSIPQSTQEPTATYETPVIDPTHSPVVPPPMPQIVIPTIVDTPAPTLVVIAATPRSLVYSPLFDAKLVVGKSVG